MNSFPFSMITNLGVIQKGNWNDTAVPRKGCGMFRTHNTNEIRTMFEGDLKKTQK